MIQVMSGRRRVSALFMLLLCVHGCGMLADKRPGASGIADAIPRSEQRSRYGNPSSYVVHGRRYYVMADARGYKERGIASWYGKKFDGKRTSSGEVYDMHKMTAAHKQLPLPSYVQVTNLENGLQVVVRVNDRGPFHAQRVIDLSYVAAVKLGLDKSGTAPVEVVVLDATAAPVAPAATNVEASNDTSSPAPGGGAPVVDKGSDLVRQLSRQPATTPAQPAAPEVSLYIQVGSFRFRENAVRQQHTLQQAGLAPTDVRVEAEQVDAQNYYRVLVGPLAGEEALSRRADELDQLGIDGYLVVER